MGVLIDEIRSAVARAIPRRLRAVAIPRRLLALAGLMLGTIGSCTLPSIKPPSL